MKKQRSVRFEAANVDQRRDQRRKALMARRQTVGSGIGMSRRLSAPVFSALW